MSLKSEVFDTADATPPHQMKEEYKAPSLNKIYAEDMLGGYQQHGPEASGGILFGS